jgi:hypothetical protein
MKELKQDQRIYFDNKVISGYGTVCGIATNDTLILGKTIIIKPDEQIGEYSHIVMFEHFINEI